MKFSKGLGCERVHGMSGGARRAILAGILLLWLLVLASACTRSKPGPSGPSPMPTPITPTLGPTKVVTATMPPAVAVAYPETGTAIPTPVVITYTMQPTVVLILPTLEPTQVMTVTPQPTATSMPAPTASPATVRHVVKAGETLSQLARTYHTTTAAILSANPAITDPDHLRVGMVITITMGTAPSARTHVVRVGETLSSIARQYGVTVQALAQANGIGDPNQVRVGQVLVIP